MQSSLSHGTSQIVTADASGMAISLTSTINLLFGSQLLVPETGIIMNNEMNGKRLPLLLILLSTKRLFSLPSSD